MTDDAAGPALGIFNAAAFAETRRPISPKDAVMVFTDGLYEVERTDGSYFDKEALRTAVAELGGKPTPDLLDALLARIKESAAEGEFNDDMCVVGVDVVDLLQAGP